MGRINILSKEIAELIAAGEVIERPSSVVKELLENSIDAGSTIITVEIKRGGTSFIRITDNGEGIYENDVKNAFIRHATSKILSKNDLNQIMTLGFRGEALASISAISKVELLTKRADEQYGTRHVVEGTEEKSFEKVGCPNGTTIIVRDIFYNVPARLKFLKKDVTEGNAISAIVSKLALSHPEISIKLIRDNKQELLTAGDGKMYSAIYAVFGRDFSTSLIPVEYEYNGFKVHGYTSKPLLSKSNRAFQNFFINGRFVKSITCMVALEEAYKNIIMTGKFPACVLNIEIPPNTIDVNVHPAKIEVRFSNEKEIYDCIYFSIKNSLMLSDKPEEMKFVNKPNFSKSELYNVVKEIEPLKQFQFKSSIASYDNEAERNIESSLESVKVINLTSDNSNLYNKIDVTDDNQTNKTTEMANNNFDNSEIDGFKYITRNSLINKPIKEEEIAVDEEINDKITPTVIGEIFKTYIVAQAGDEMILVDKHAAHERFIFEKIKTNLNDLDIQLLISPIALTMSYEEVDVLCNNLDTLKRIGILVERNEKSIISILGVPFLIQEEDISHLVSEIADNLIQNKHNPSPSIIDDLLHSIACKAAIKANDITSTLELQKLLDDIYFDENVRYCPHGRPVFTKISKKDIEKQFKRIL